MTTQTLLASVKYMRHVGSTAPKNPSRLDIMGRRRLEQSLRASKRDLFGYRWHSHSTITRAQISLSADHVNLNCIEPRQGFVSIDHALNHIAVSGSRMPLETVNTARLKRASFSSEEPKARRSPRFT
jgi:hypothetical protein